MRALHTLRRCRVAKVNMYLDKCRLSLPKLLQCRLSFSLSFSPCLSLSLHFNCLPHTQLILLIEIAVATRLIGSYSSLWPASPNGVRASPACARAYQLHAQVASGKWRPNECNGQKLEQWKRNKKCMNEFPKHLHTVSHCGTVGTFTVLTISNIFACHKNWILVYDIVQCHKCI